MAWMKILKIFFSGGLKWHAVTSRASLTLIGEQAKLSADAYVRFKNRMFKEKIAGLFARLPDFFAVIYIFYRATPLYKKY